MMFRKSEELDIEGLDDFIEKPSQDFTDEKELQKGIDKVIVVLNKNPVALMNIIKNHPFIAAIFLLDNLADKMREMGCLEKLELLFNKCSNDLVGACVYNLRDLERCFNSLPTCSDKIMEVLLSNEDYIKRVLESDENPKGTLKEISEKYPSYKKQFSECYNKCFKPASQEVQRLVLSLSPLPSVML